MNSLERVLCAINHVKPDRTPVDFYAVGDIWDKVKKYFNTNSKDRVLEALNIDCRWIDPIYKGTASKIYEDGTFEGFGGSLYKKVRNEYGSYDDIIKYALNGIGSDKDIEKLLVLPDLDKYDYNVISEGCKKYDKYCIISGWACTFYTSTLVRSMEDFLVDMAIEPDLAEYLIEKLVNWHIGYNERILSAGKGRINFIHIADDYSTQQSPLISMNMFTKFFKPHLNKYVDLANSYGAKAYQHCCGSAYKLIPEFINSGVEMLDPIQTTAVDMDPVRLKAEFGNKITFHGAVDTQSILPHGTPEDVRKNVRYLAQILGKDGGYIMSSCHYLQSDVTVENILAMYEMNIR